MKNHFDKDFYREIVENNPNGIVICDDLHHIIYCNKELERLIDSTFAGISGKHIEELVCLENGNIKDFSKHPDSTTISSSFDSNRGELTASTGEKILVKIDQNKISSDENNYFLIVISPLSESICLNQAHLDFVSTVSHELRTPLTSIKGFADTLLSSGDRLPKEHHQRFLTIIKTQIDRLTRLVENLLTVSRLESRKNKPIFKAIKFKDFIEPVVQVIQSKFPDHKFEITVPSNLPEIWADSDKLEQVMTNLIDNAAKYSKAETTVFIKAAFKGGHSERIDIKIIDEGIGIPKEYADKIFTKFSRIDNPLTRDVQGTGLGLYITKTIVENMGGKIYLKSYDRGSEFTVEIPMATIEKQTGERFVDKPWRSDNA